MKARSPVYKEVPLDMVGSSKFGRYPKISSEQTYNMIISDDFLVPYPGYKMVVPINPASQGRGIFKSSRLGKMVVVIGNGAYVVDAQLNYSRIGTLQSVVGDVFIDENDNNQIAICDKVKIYVYKYLTGEFITPSLDFTPGYVAFQNGYFIAPVIGTNVGSGVWRLSAPNDGTSWPFSAQTVGTFQTKPDQPVAAIRFPARGNLLWVMGSNVTEPWTDTGGALFPYTRSQSYNIDYGCLNPATIAFGDSFVIWLGSNEKSGPVILYSTGGDIQQISTDGINFRLAQLNNPSNAYGFLYKQGGHLLYQLTFPDQADQISYVWDFTTSNFFTLTNEDMGAHIAKRVVFFNNTYYFVSLIDGNLYELSSKYTNYDYSPNPEVQTIVKEIPRIRICKTNRLPDTSGWICNNANFIIEQGQSNNLRQSFLDESEINSNFIQPQRVDLSISRDGGETYGNIISYEMNRPGIRSNRMQFWNLGYANEITMQYRFWGFQRFVVGNGMMGLFQ